MFTEPTLIVLVAMIAITALGLGTVAIVFGRMFRMSVRRDEVTVGVDVLPDKDA